MRTQHVEHDHNTVRSHTAALGEVRLLTHASSVAKARRARAALTLAAPPIAVVARYHVSLLAEHMIRRPCENSAALPAVPTPRDLAATVILRGCQPLPPVTPELARQSSSHS
jgi:hypothetical protein